MPDRKTIAVIGATGAQGGGLVRAILADPERRFVGAHMLSMLGGIVGDEAVQGAMSQ